MSEMSDELIRQLIAQMNTVSSDVGGMKAQLEGVAEGQSRIEHKLDGNGQPGLVKQSLIHEGEIEQLKKTVDAIVKAMQAKEEAEQEKANKEAEDAKESKRDRTKYWAGIGASMFLFVISTAVDIFLFVKGWK